MAKLTALLLGTLAFFVISVSLLPSSFNPVIDWLGPIFGLPLKVMLALLFFIMGNPLANGAVLATWIIVGAIVGVCTRGLKSALASAPAVFTFALTLFGIVFGGVALALANSGIPSGNFPPPPPGTNAATILSVPVFKDIAPLMIGGLLNGLGSGGASPPSFGSSIGSIAPTLILPLIANLAILVATAAGVGFGLGRLSKRFKATNFGKSGDGPVSATQIKQPMPIARASFALLVIAVLLVATFIFVSFPVVRADSSHYYSETVLATVGSFGNTTDFYAFATQSLSIPSGGRVLSTEGTSSLSNAIFAVEISQSGAFDILPSSLSQSFQSMLGLVPPSLVVMAFNGNCGMNQVIAGDVSGSFASAFHLNDLSYLLCTQVSFGQLGLQGISGSGALFVYQSNVGIASTASDLVNTVNPSIAQDGLIQIFNQGLSSGFLIPESSASGVRSSAILAGFASSQFLGNLPVVGPVFQHISSSGLVGFSAGIATLKATLTSSSNTHRVAFSDLVNYRGDISFSKSSTLSIVGIGVPNANSPPGSQQPSNYNFTILTNNVDTTKALLSGQAQVQLMQPGQTTNASDLTSTFQKQFPASVTMTKSLTTQSDGSLVVTVVVKNTDSEPISNLAFDDSSFVREYQGGLVVSSGSPLGSNNGNSPLQPNASVSYSYAVKPSGIGTYVSLPATLSYSVNGTEFKAYSNIAYYTVPSSNSPSQAIQTLIDSEGASIDSLIGTSSGTGALIIMAALIALFAASFFMEYRAFVKWRKPAPVKTY